MSNDAITVKAHEHNAPIEIKQKAPEMNQVNLPEVVGKKSESEDALEKRKKKVQQAAVRLFKQVKIGCNKDICFNEFCRKNP